MTILYRTPNIVVDDFEFYALVEVRKGRPRRHFYLRPLSEKPVMWEPLSKFKGNRPKYKQLAKRFQPFKKHMVQAEQSVVENRQLARELMQKRKERFAERAAA